VGGSIVLDRYLPTYGRERRRLFVTKVRGSDFLEGFHDYEIVTGGVTVYPRLKVCENPEAFTAEHLSSGVENLDVMLHGGLSSGSTTLLLGPAGAGKSTTAMQFVVSALKRRQKAAVYVFDEVRQTMIARAEKLCLGKSGGIEGFVKEGLLHIQQVDPSEKSPGAFAHEVRRVVTDGARVVVIDSLNGYLNSMPEERFLTTHLHELFTFLNQRGVLTIVVVAQHGMMAAGARDGTIDVSYLADSVLLFRYYEAAGEVNQAVSVFKKRTGPHERSIRQLTIDESGLAVGEPLRKFRGIMTGVPQYRDADLSRAESAPAERGLAPNL
jgi:circadian clock protein KaiC